MKKDSHKDDLDEDKKKRDIDPEKLESMDKKLQSIEDFIIDETIKYTGAHEGINNQDEIRKLKDHVLSRLATAYSLEKMRRALDKLFVHDKCNELEAKVYTHILSFDLMALRLCLKGRQQLDACT